MSTMKTLGSVQFPIYVVKAIGTRHYFVAGGGGTAKTGVPNTINVFEIQRNDAKECISNLVVDYSTGSEAIMNGSLYTHQNGSFFTFAAGKGSNCCLYDMSYLIQTTQRDSSDEDSPPKIRQRKSNLSTSSRFNLSDKSISFNINKTSQETTDFSDIVDIPGFQKCVDFSTDGSHVATGGADGHIRFWSVPSFTKVHDISAHKDEIDAISIHPFLPQLVSVSRDRQGYVWDLKTGKLISGLAWTTNTSAPFRMRYCKFGLIEDYPKKCRLFTIHIPNIKRSIEGKNVPCYITKWDPENYSVQLSAATKSADPLCCLTVSDTGTYLGVGTVLGSVSIYISFSLQLLHHVEKAHSLFVTALEFLPSKPESLHLQGFATSGSNAAPVDCSLLSVSADQLVKIHQVASRSSWSIFWVISGAAFLIYLAMLITSNLHLLNW